VVLRGDDQLARNVLQPRLAQNLGQRGRDVGLRISSVPFR
jgi:hypothetical protein